MIRKTAVLAAAFALALPLVVAFGAAFAAERPTWVDRSDILAAPVLEAQLMDQPEFLSFVGTPGADVRIIDWKPDREVRYQAQLVRSRKALVAARRSERSAEVRRDIDALLEAVDNGLRISRASQQLQRPWLDAPLRVFQGMQSLLFDQTPPARRAIAATRLRAYLGDGGSTSLFQDVQDRYQEADGHGLVHPSASDVQQAIDRGPIYVQGIRALCQRHQLADCQGLTDELDRQVNAHRAWLRETVLPEARTSPLPRRLYEAHLQRAGVDITPEALIALARSSFGETQQQMQAVAAIVAAERGWPERDYRAVFQRLKAERLPDEEVVEHYRAVMAEIDNTIRRENIVTLPAHALTMRLGSAAESAAQPAPQFFPAPLFGPTDGAGQFVLPLSNPASGGVEDRYDDFSFRAAAWTLAAHEGHPGHGLQFARFTEMPLPMARTILTFNSVNAEGWALYAEGEMLPYQSPDAQLAMLQFRLLRAARAFLDPQIQLGQVSREEAELVLRHDVGLSAPMARQELDRYEFKMVGQAPSYFYGYYRMLGLRKLAETRQGAHFDRRRFNDFVIAQGMASPAMLEKAVRNQHAPW